MPSPRWQRGFSANPAGRPRGSRNKLSEAVICAFYRDFSKHGEKTIAKVRRDKPGVWLKVLAQLIPRQHEIEHRNVLKELSDEELEALIAHLEASLEAQAHDRLKVIEGTIEPTAVEATPSPALDPPKPKNRLMVEADTAVGPRERLPRKVPSPAST